MKSYYRFLPVEVKCYVEMFIYIPFKKRDKLEITLEKELIFILRFVGSNNVNNDIN